MSLISNLFSFKVLIFVLLLGAGTFALTRFMDYRNNIVGAFLPSVMGNIKLVIYLIAFLAGCFVVWKMIDVVEENKTLAVNNAVQQVSIDSASKKEAIVDAVDKINEKKVLDSVQADRKTESKINRILDNSAKREKIITDTFDGKVKQEALSAERISTLWEIYNSNIKEKNDVQV